MKCILNQEPFSLQYKQILEQEEVAQYERVRVIELIGGKWMVCSCGIPYRMKGPCPHVFRVVGRYDSSMYLVRWHSLFQHWYGCGDEALDGVFDKLLYGEWIGVDVSKVYCKPASTSDFTFPMADDMSLRQETIQRMIQLERIIHNGGAVLVGSPINLGGKADLEDFVPPSDGDSPQKSIDGMSVTSVHSPGTRHILSQEFQCQAAEEIGGEVNSDYCSLKKEFEEMWRIVEGNQNLHSMMRSQLDLARANITAAVHSQQSLQSLVEQTEGTYDMGAHVLDREKNSKWPRYNFER